MTSPEIKEIFSRVGAIITDSHIVYSSGKHGSAYVNKDALYPHVRATARVCEELAHRASMISDFQVVVAPALGGVALSQWVAYYLGRPILHPLDFSISRDEVLALYADKTEAGDFILKRGYDKLVQGRRVLVVEDILTTGGSAKKTVEAVRAASGAVLSVGALCNRGGVTAYDLGVNDLFSLLDLSLDAWDAAVCPLCANNVPINTDVGHGREFLAKQRMA